MPKEFSPQRLDTRQAAQYLGIATQTLYNLRHKRLGPNYIKIGAKVIYNISDLDLYLDENRVVLD